MILTKDELQSNSIIDRHKNIVIATSIGGAPIHSGHCSILQESKKVVDAYLFDQLRQLSHFFYPTVKTSEDLQKVRFADIKLVVIVNCDDFLKRKHGFAFQSEYDRAFVIDSIKGVDYTYIHQSEDDDVVDALSVICPQFFTKGGDRTENNMNQKEIEFCDKNGCKILYGVGGTDKKYSSSTIIDNAVQTKNALDKVHLYSVDKITALINEEWKKQMKSDNWFPLYTGDSIVFNPPIYNESPKQ